MLFRGDYNYFDLCVVIFIYFIVLFSCFIDFVVYRFIYVVFDNEIEFLYIEDEI